MFNPPIKTIALTGGIASGKSLVKQILEEAGVAVIDADDLTHELYATDETLKAQIRGVYGDAVLNEEGDVDRRKLGQYVFGNPEALKQLSEWIHPKVRERIQAYFKTVQENLSRKYNMAVAVIPVLYESQSQHLYDEVWVVKATVEQQKARLMARNQFSQAEAEARINSQIPLAQKVQWAHWVIDNTGSPEETKKQLISKLALS